MKILMMAFMMTLFVSMIFYIAGAVVGASFYIPDWDFNTRGVIAFFWVFAMIAVFVFALSIKEK